MGQNLCRVQQASKRGCLSIFRTKPVLFLLETHFNKFCKINMWQKQPHESQTQPFQSTLNVFLNVCFAEIVVSWVIFIVFPSSTCLFHQRSQWEEECEFHGSCSWKSRSKPQHHLCNKVKQGEWVNCDYHTGYHLCSCEAGWKQRRNTKETIFVLLFHSLAGSSAWSDHAHKQDPAPSLVAPDFRLTSQFTTMQF